MIDDPARGGGASQGPYGAGKALAFEDGGTYVYGAADITGAYAYGPAPAEAGARSVVREILYLRPAAVVIFDNAEPAKADYKRSIVFNFPFSAAPRLNKRAILGQVGNAAFRVFSMAPTPPAIDLEERFGTTPGDEAAGIHTWAARINGVAGDKSRFLTVFSAAKAQDDGDFAGIKPTMGWSNGVVLSDGTATSAVFFAPKGSKAFSCELPAKGAVDLYVAGMEPQKSYKLSATPSAQGVVVHVDQAPGGDMSSATGVFRARLEQRAKTKL
jgi:hypothetical protein